MRPLSLGTLSVLALASCGSPQQSPAPKPVAAQPKPVPGVDAGSAAIATDAGSAAGPVTGADAPKGEIVTEEIVAMNGAEFGRPPTTFQPGNPTPRASPTATKTATGFQVAFESAASITTPTVYDRAVIVSGGFQSKELYAFEKTTGKPLWALDLGDDGPSSPACENHTCVISTESCTIFAIASDTGKPLWSYFLGDPLTSAPTIANNRVFASYPAASTADGKPMPPNASHALAAFDLKTGKILWQMWLDSDVMSAPVAVGDFVYVTTFAGTVIKFEQATGKVRYAMRARATSAPVVQFAKDGVESMYYTRRGEQADEDRDGAAEEMLIRADHNEPQTRYKTAARKATYIDGDKQKASAHAAASAAQDAHNGFSGGAPSSAKAEAAYGNVGVANVSSMQGYQGSRVLKLADRSVNTMGDEVIATDAETGTQIWSYKLPGSLDVGGSLGTAPLAAGNSVMFATLDGHVQRLDAKTGKTIATYDVPGAVRSQPVVDGGWIYVGTEDGKLVAINTHDSHVTGWPTWGGNAQRTGVATP